MMGYFNHDNGVYYDSDGTPVQCFYKGKVYSIKGRGDFYATKCSEFEFNEMLRKKESFWGILFGW